MVRKPRVSTDGAERARAEAELEALAELLPVTDGHGGPPESGPPVDAQIVVRDEARDLLERGAATPEQADRLWSRLPNYWRWQFTARGVGEFAARARRLGLFDERWNERRRRQAGRWG